MNTNTETPLMDSLKANDPALFRRLMDGIENQVTFGAALDLGVDMRTARAALRTAGRI